MVKSRAISRIDGRSGLTVKVVARPNLMASKAIETSTGAEIKY